MNNKEVQKGLWFIWVVFGTSQTSMMGIFCYNSKRLKMVLYKHCILDIWQGPKQSLIPTSYYPIHKETTFWVSVVLQFMEKQGKHLKFCTRLKCNNFFNGNKKKISFVEITSFTFVSLTNYNPVLLFYTP